MDVIEALGNLIEDAGRTVESAHDEGDGYVIVNLYALQDLTEALRLARHALDWYRDREAEAAA